MKKIRLHEIDNERQIHHKSSDLNRQISDMITAHESIQKVNDKLSQANDQKSKEDVKKQQEFEEEFIENTKLQEKKVRIVVNLLKIQEQLLEREQVVFSKDETIKMARDEQINLENFQFMLDQKIKSLKANKSKLNEEIDSKEKILRDMFNELIKQSQANNSLNKDIKDRLQKMQILGEHMRKIDLNIYYWSVKIKDYHRKIMSKINTTKKSNEVKMLVNKLISDSNIEQAKNPERVIDEKKVLGIANASSDVGTSVHKELIEQNMWLIKKLNMIDQAADNIKRIREENIDTGLSQNKKLIEECNKLNVDNDILHKKHSHFAKIIESVNKLKKEEQQKTANLMKHNRENGPTKMAGSSMLPRLLQNQVSEVSESRQSEARLSKGKPAGPPSGVSNNRGIISVSHTVIKKRPGPALRR